MRVGTGTGTGTDRASDEERARAVFGATSRAAQCAADAISARARGDLVGAHRLLASLGERQRADGSLFLADLAINLLASSWGRPADIVAAELRDHPTQLSAETIA